MRLPRPPGAQAAALRNVACCAAFVLLVVLQLVFLGGPAASACPAAAILLLLHPEAPGFGFLRGSWTAAWVPPCAAASALAAWQVTSSAASLVLRPPLDRSIMWPALRLAVNVGAAAPAQAHLLRYLARRADAGLCRGEGAVVVSLLPLGLLSTLVADTAALRFPGCLSMAFGCAQLFILHYRRNAAMRRL